MANKFLGLFEKYRLHSFFTKLLTSYILLMVIPLLILGSIIYTKSSEVLKLQVEQMNINSLLNTGNILDSRINDIYRVIYQSANNHSVLYYQNVRTPVNNDDIQESVRIFEHLRSIKVSNDLVEDLFIYFRSINQIISCQSIYDPGTYFNRIYKYEKFDLYQWQEILNGVNRLNIVPTGAAVKYPYENGNSVNTLTIVNSLPLSGLVPKATFVISLKEEKLREIISKSDLTQQGVTFILDGKGTVISHSGNVETLSTVDSGEVYRQIVKTGLDQGFFNQDGPGEKKTISFVKSDISDWYMVSVISASFFTDKSSYIKSLTLVFSAVLILVSFIISYIVSRRIYRPIHSIIDFITGSALMQKVVKDQAKDEFTLISSSLARMYEDNRNLEEHREKNLPIIRERFFYHLAKGFFDTQEDIRNKMKELQIEFKGAYFSVTAIQLDNYISYREKNPVLFQQIHFEVMGLIAERTKEAGIHTAAFLDDYYMGVMINHDLDDGRIYEFLNDFYNDIRQTLEQRLGVTISAGIGATVSSIDFVRHAYEEAVIALREKIFIGKGQIIFYTDNELANEDAFYFPTSEEDKISACLNSGDIDKTWGSIEGIIDYNLAVNKKNYEYLNQLFRQLVGLAVKAVYEAGSTLRDIFGGSYNVYTELSRCETIEEVKSFLKNQYALIGKHLAGINRERNIIEDTVVDYIKNNYYRDFSLQEIAEYYHLSPRFFSHNFKKITGMSLIDFINSYRVEKAKELILNTDKKLQQVSEEVGFNSYKTFSRAFNKYVGVSADKFRSFPR